MKGLYSLGTIAPSKKGYSPLLRAPELEPHHQLSIIPRTPLAGVLLFYRGCSLHILNPIDWAVNKNSVIPIGLYTPINYFGRYATCSHKDGGRSMFSLGKPLARRTTWYAYNYVGMRKFKFCVFEPFTRRVFSINTSSSSTLLLFDQFSPQQQHHEWAL